MFTDGKLSSALDRSSHGVEAVGALDSTNISSGAREGLQPLGGEGIALRRIFLFSDGEANAGVVRLHELDQVVKFIHNHGANITSFGISNGYNEKLMRGIANTGHGGTFHTRIFMIVEAIDQFPDFFHIEKPKRHLLRHIVAKGMSVLTTLVASNLTSNLTCTPRNWAFVLRI